MTAGSCFAQHVGRALKQHDFNVIDTEPLPADIPDAVALKFGYRMYSARYGNIYTARQLVQLLDEVEGTFRPAHPVWHRGNRHFDAMRPNVEPDGLDNAELVLEHRRLHLENTARAFDSANLFIFTFGLTEAWVHTGTQTVYPTAPGTFATIETPEEITFHNFSYSETLADFEEFRTRMKTRNQDMRFLVTTSPVPLTATASGEHVEVATCYSKSVLRAVCGALYQKYDDVDYFPSYEVITSLNNRGVYFENNKRSVSKAGVRAAMDLFLTAHLGEMPGSTLQKKVNEGAVRKSAKQGKSARSKAAEDADVICEDILLEAFSR